MEDIKRGDKVIVISDIYKNFKKGDVLIVESVTNSKDGYMCKPLNKGEAKIMLKCEIEKFIEPKFKVGDTFILDTDEGVFEIEIVKLSLNKKLKQYAYLMFDVKDGKVGAVLETDLIKNKLFKKIIKPKEMTVDEISKKLGYKVIVKK